MAGRTKHNEERIMHSQREIEAEAKTHYEKLQRARERERQNEGVRDHHCVSHLHLISLQMSNASLAYTRHPALLICQTPQAYNPPALIKDSVKPLLRTSPLYSQLDKSTTTALSPSSLSTHKSNTNSTYYDVVVITINFQSHITSPLTPHQYFVSLSIVHC